MHPQTWARVNTHVDKGIAPLIEALSMFPLLQTLESCEGDDTQAAWVCFFYGAYWADPWVPLAGFVLHELGPPLAAMVGDNARLSVRVTETGTALGEIAVNKAAMADVESAIRRIAAGISARPLHSLGCCDGRSGTSQGCC